MVTVGPRGWGEGGAFQGWPQGCRVRCSGKVVACFFVYLGAPGRNVVLSRVGSEELLSGFGSCVRKMGGRMSRVEERKNDTILQRSQSAESRGTCTY